MRSTAGWTGSPSCESTSPRRPTAGASPWRGSYGSRATAGRLRARGHVLADQYAMARRAGFDEVEIDAALAARQPEAQWLARAGWQAFDHQARLRG